VNCINRNLRIQLVFHWPDWLYYNIL